MFLDVFVMLDKLVQYLRTHSCIDATRGNHIGTFITEEAEKVRMSKPVRIHFNRVWGVAPHSAFRSVDCLYNDLHYVESHRSPVLDPIWELAVKPPLNKK